MNRDPDYEHHRSQSAEAISNYGTQTDTTDQRTEGGGELGKS